MQTAKVQNVGKEAEEYVAQNGLQDVVDSFMGCFPGTDTESESEESDSEDDDDNWD